MKKINKLFMIFAMICFACTLASCNCGNYQRDGLHISYESKQYLMQEGTTLELTPIITNGSLGTTTLFYTVGDENVATCEDGVVTALSAGQTNIKIGFNADPSIYTNILIVVEPTYYITYNLNGGENHKGNPDKYYDSKCPYVLQEPTRKGYEFKGWFDENDQPVETIPAGTQKDLTFTAKWEIITYTINYDLGDGTHPTEYESYEDVVKTYLDAYNEYRQTTYTPEEFGQLEFKNNLADGRNEYVFFYTQSVGQNMKWLVRYFIQVSENKELLDKFYSLYRINTTSNVVFKDSTYAVVTELRGFISSTQYTATLEDGTVYTSADYSKQEVRDQIMDFIPKYSYTVEDETFVLAPGHIHQYDFVGWYDEDGNLYDIIEKGSVGNLNLTAKYEIRKYPLTLVLNGGQLSDGQEVPTTYDIENKNLTDYVPVKEGYTFDEWYLDEEFTEIASGSYLARQMNFGKPHTLYARFVPVVYNITYNLGEDEYVTKPYESYEEVAADLLANLNATLAHNKVDRQFTAEEYGKVQFEKPDGTLDFNGVQELYSWGRENASLYWILEYFLEVSPNKDLIKEFKKIVRFNAIDWRNKHDAICQVAAEMRGFVSQTQYTSSSRDKTYTSADYSDENVRNEILKYIHKHTYTVEDETFDLLPAQKLHYTFLGWFDEEGNQVTKVEKGSIGDLNLTAKMETVKYELQYVLNGGSFPEDLEVRYFYDFENYELNDIVPVKDGYTFNGWYLTPEFKNQVTYFRHYFGEDFTLYAKWTPTVYNINYVSEDGYVVPAYQTYEEIVDALLAAYNAYSGEELTKNDFTMEVAEEISYSGELMFLYGNNEWRWLVDYFMEVGQYAELIKELDNSNGITVLYAEKREALSALVAEFRGFISGTQYTAAKYFEGFVSANYADETVNEKVLAFIPKYTYTVEDETFELLPAYKNYYDFVGWFDEDGNQVTKVEKGSFGELTLNAKFKATEHKLTLVLNGGVLPEGQDSVTTYSIENRSLAQYVPTKEGYDFLGWSRDEDSTNVVASDNIPFRYHDDLTYYAVWKPTEYTITYDCGEDGYVPVYFDDIDLFASDLLGTFNKSTTYTPEDYGLLSLEDDGGFEEFNSFYRKNYEYRWLFDFFISVNPDNELLPELKKLKLFNSFYWVYNRPLILQLASELRGFISGEQYTSTYKDVTYTSANYADEAVRNKVLDFVPKYTYTIEDETFELKDGYKFQYKFLGWFDEEGNQVTKVEKGSVGNIVLTAKYEAINYDLLFDLAGGTLPEETELPTTYNIETTDLSTYEEIVPTKTGYTFTGWKWDKHITRYFGETRTLIANWELEEYTIEYDCVEGQFPVVAKTIDEFVTEFITDFNKYGNSNVTAASFHTQSSASIKDAFASSAMLTKYKWLFEYILDEIEVNATATKLTDTEIYKEGKELLTSLIACDILAINGDYVNGRSVIRHFLHNLLNKNHLSVGSTNNTYTPYTTDYSYAGNVAKFETKFVPATKYTIETETFDLLVPVKDGYEFVGWMNDEGTLFTKLDKGSLGDIKFTAKWEAYDLTEYTITYELNSGAFNSTCSNIDEFADEFIADFNKYASVSTVTKAEFYTTSHTNSYSAIKKAFANAEMLAKYKWFFEYILVEFEENVVNSNFNTSDENYKQTVELLSGLIEGNTNVVNGDYSKGRSIVRHFIHNLVNKNHLSAGTTNGLYLKFTNDFSNAEVVAEFEKQFVVLKKYTKYTDSFKLPEPIREGYYFIGWDDGNGNLITEVVKGTTGNLTLTAIYIYDNQ